MHLNVFLPADSSLAVKDVVKDFHPGGRLAQYSHGEVRAPLQPGLNTDPECALATVFQSKCTYKTSRTDSLLLYESGCSPASVQVHSGWALDSNAELYTLNSVGSFLIRMILVMYIKSIIILLSVLIAWLHYLCDSSIWNEVNTCKYSLICIFHSHAFFIEKLLQNFKIVKKLWSPGHESFHFWLLESCDDEFHLCLQYIDAVNNVVTWRIL